MNYTLKDIADKLDLIFHIGDNKLLTSLMFRDDNNFINFSGHSKGQKQFYLTVKDLYPIVNEKMLYEDFVINLKLIRSNYNLTRDYHQTSSLYPNLEFRYEESDEPKMKDYSKLFKLLDGLTLPINHKFWNTYIPPNHFGDNCSVKITDKSINLIPENLPNVEDRFIIDRIDLFFDKSPFNKEEVKEISLKKHNLTFENIGIDMNKILNDVKKDITLN